MKKITLIKVILALAPLMMALPFAMDIYVPAVPKIATQFHISDATMQLTLNLFMLMSGITQLFVGPLTDRWGRRPIVFLCALIFSVGCLVCAYSTSISLLLVGRLIEAVGACGMMTLGFTIAKDLYSDTKLAKIYSILNGIISFSPMFAPSIGGFLDIHFGWPSTFKSLLIIPVISLLFYFWLLPETCEKRTKKLAIKTISFTYKTILSNKVFLLYTIATAIGLSYLFLFCAMSPIILIKLLHIPEAHFGYYFCFMGFSFFIGSVFSVFILEKLKIYKTTLLGFIITLIGGTIMLLCHLVYGLSLGGFIFPMVLIGIGGTLSMGAGSAGLMHPFNSDAGSASALSGSFRFFFAAIVGLVTAKHIHSALPLALASLLFSIIGIIVFKTKQKILQFQEAS